jgi:short-subunit dehydrogenase
MKVLKNKCALITGATGGLGKNIAISLARQGTNLVLLGRNLAKLKKMKSHLDKLKVDVKYFQIDLNDRENLISFLNSDDVLKLDIDILINCAGVFSVEKLTSSRTEDILDMFNINIIAPTLLCRHFIPNMSQKKWGRIINIASSSAYAAAPGTSIYSSTKHALLGLSRALYKELKKDNIRVFCVSPGTIKTEMGKKVEELGQKYDTFLEPSDVSEYIAYAMSIDSELISEEIRLNRVEVQ